MEKYMKKVVALFTAIISINLFAAPVPQNEIDRLNAILALMPSEYISAQVISAEKDDVTKKITAISATATILVNENPVTTNLTLKSLGDNQIYVLGDVTGQLSEKPLTATQILALTAMAKPFVTRLNDSDDFEATLASVTSITSTDIQVLIKSLQGENFDEVMMNLSIPKESTMITGGFEGTLYYKDGLIKLIATLLRNSK
jgi:hypothetical protein